MNKILRSSANIIIRMIDYYHTEYYSVRCADTTNKPILMPITRKGYWLFRMLFDRQEELGIKHICDKFEIRSDRYMTKVLDGACFEGRYVLMFDDTLDSGRVMFEYYALLRKWGADVMPLAYHYLMKDSERLGEEDNLQTLRWEYFLKLSRDKEGEESFNEELCRQQYQEYLQDFNCSFKWFPERHFLTENDRAIFNINEIRMFEEELIPLIIDLPIIVDKNFKTYNRYVTMPIQMWEEMLFGERAEWKFVKNIKEETKGVRINGSFLRAPESVCNKIFNGAIVNCIVKCKYRVVEDMIQAVFVPFAVMKSISYEDLCDIFCVLFEGTEYCESVLNDVKKEGMEQLEIRDILVKCISYHYNLYRALYRAVIWYFSNYIGMEFIKSFSPLDNEMGWDYDWTFMDQNIPIELKNTIRNIKKNGLEQIYDRLSKLSTYHIIEIDTDKFQKNEVTITKCQDIYDYMKYKVAKSKIEFRKSGKNILSIEELDSIMKYDLGIYDKEVRQLNLLKIISLFQEGSCFSNYVENNKKEGIIYRGFIAGENSIVLMGLTMECIFPYIYAYYMKTGINEFQKTYDDFVVWLKAYFESKEYIDTKVTRNGFEYCTDYFRTNDAKALSKIIKSNMFLVQTQSQAWKNIFFTVDKWKI